MFTVYVLKSQKNHRLYIGQTNDLPRRLSEHSTRSGHYTSNTGPYKLVYSEKYTDRQEAIAREKYLKSGKGRQFLHDKILNNTL